MNSPNQWKSLEARSGLLRGLGSNSHLNSRNIASWHKDQSNSGVVSLSTAAGTTSELPLIGITNFRNYHSSMLITNIAITNINEW